MTLQRTVLVAMFCGSLLACGAGSDEAVAQSELDAAKTRHCKQDSDCKSGQTCQSNICKAGTGGGGGGGTGGGTGGTGGGTGAPGGLPPASCDQRHAGVTAIHAIIQVTSYKGVQHGHNGDHELIVGTMTSIPWVFDGTIVDTHGVQLALNVSSSIDPSGLPHEIPLQTGATLEVEGEFIPKSQASANGNAVIHYTHSPCGWVLINGQLYQ